MLTVALLVVLLDRLSKHLIVSRMTLGSSVPVISGVFHITYIENAGAAFGMLVNQQSLFIAAGVALLAAAAYLYPRLRRGSRLLRYGAAVLLGGTVGNLIDRIELGHVVDFFDFRVYPVFNVADIAIVLGVAAIIYDIVVKNEELGAAT